ncbi:MAG: DUF86 domain-containing protein [Chloroflexi bacterium]|nr:DUF86 domain-containing protein [Chloroflexota bacterium]
MSNLDEEPRSWRLYIQDMLACGEKVLAYAEGMTQTAFVADSRTYDAVLRNLELIGEAATHVPVDVRESTPQVEWRNIIGVRNRVAHGYLGIDDDVVWDIIQNNVPRLLPELRRLLRTAW